MTSGKKAPHIFEFEQDFSGSFRCITMSMRQKLDFAGIKLTLEQWEKLSHEQREELFNAPCTEDKKSAEHYADLVRQAVKKSCGESVKDLGNAHLELWQETSSVPETVAKLAEKTAGKKITAAEWAGLTPLQRFALLKLSQSKHESEHMNFRPAMQEFGLLPK